MVVPMRRCTKEGTMRKLLIALNVCLMVTACNHLSGEGGPTTTHEYDKDNGNGNGGGNGGGY